MSLLSSVKVLDFSTLLPGPYASMLLADLGAEILRIESPTRKDLVRDLPPILGNSSAAHQFLNRSKRSLSLDLKNAEAIKIIKKLIATYDVVLEQFRPGVMDRLGLGYESLKEINPKLIYCSITGYGQTGPYRDRAGHDINYLALSGISSYSRRVGKSPLPLGIQVADVAGGSLHGVIGILTALYHREKTGEGRAIDISMTDAAFALNGMSGAGYLAGGVEPQAETDLLNGGSFYDYYETKDGRFYSVGSLEPKFYKGFCSAIGISETLINNHSKEDFKEIIKNEFHKKTFSEWEKIFDVIDVCVEPVLKFSEACEHPQLQARKMVVEVDGQKQIGCPIKFTSHQTLYRGKGGSVGSDSKPVLTELALSEQEIDFLISDGVVKA